MRHRARMTRCSATGEFFSHQHSHLSECPHSSSTFHNVYQTRGQRQNCSSADVHIALGKMLTNLQQRFHHHCGSRRSCFRGRLFASFEFTCGKIHFLNFPVTFSSVDGSQGIQTSRRVGERDSGGSLQFTSQSASAAGAPPISARVLVSPDQLSSAAQEKMRCLEAAIAALGPNPDATLKTLQDALQAARSVANVPPVGVRLDSCVQFVERARRRLAKAEEDFNRVQEERAKLAAQLSEGLARLETLRAEAAVPGPPPPPPAPSQETHHLQEVTVDSKPSWPR